MEELTIRRWELVLLPSDNITLTMWVRGDKPIKIEGKKGAFNELLIALVNRRVPGETIDETS